MDAEKKLIEEYIANALPEGRVSDLRFEPSSRTDMIRFNAEGRVSFGKGRSFPAIFEIKQSMSLASLQDAIALFKCLGSKEADDYAKIILSPYLSDKKQSMLRESGIGFIDGVGNAWIDTKNVFIDKRGNKPERVLSSQSGVSSVFSDKATLVSRLLFDGDSKGVREISFLLEDQGFGLTPGYVSKVISSLVENHYAKRSDEGARLINQELFLEDWVSVYRQKSIRKRSEGWFCPMPNPEELALEVGTRLKGSGILTDRSGAFFVDPHSAFESIDVLAKDKNRAVESLLGMDAQPVERGANINLIEPYYSVSAFFGSREIEGIDVAADLQLYLDLSCQPKRGLEAAEHLFSRRILPMIEGGTADG